MNPSSGHSLTSTSIDIESRHISLLSEQLDMLYQAFKSERMAIAQWEEDQEFSILGVLELFSTEVQGYAEQIKLGQFTSPLAHSVDHLRQLNLFRIDYFVNWYFQNLEQYPQTKQYIEGLDHLRLSMLECLNNRLSAAA
ncbi:hypothetical protein HJG54_32385 [Leptolyngbya sp. NK1-12]|uniref:Uncharacterized protein n=1 Tax=Leptolyngbya sp. NK1-12 TaxID=2547451 RepID=A0AA96WLA1_9CYAN|nr:hypothetical protein [Leptolyngbya sp. NK1-12]WNZ27568.1 hypothetical protein HJG54_32385 [Leptolyngbya sp. NK1-12]